MLTASNSSTLLPPAPEVLACLEAVLDPEVGLSVVDLGLVYRATRTRAAVEVALTLTSRACPLGEMIVADARERLARSFPDVAEIRVSLMWEPAWSPALITGRGLLSLGHPASRA